VWTNWGWVRSGCGRRSLGRSEAAGLPARRDL